MQKEESNQSKYIKPATIELAWQSSKFLRWQDKQELEGLGHPPFFALPMSVAVTKDPICFYNPQGELSGFAGVVDEGDGIGRVWMLTTPAVETMPILFFKEAKKWLEGLNYQMLHNIMDPRNRMHLKLLHMLGFKRLCYVPVGPKRLTYVEFAKLCVNQPQLQQ
jgi:hypothetical protein